MRSAKFANLGATKTIDDIMQQISENDKRFCKYQPGIEKPSIHYKFLDDLPIYVHFMLNDKAKAIDINAK